LAFIERKIALERPIHIRYVLPRMSARRQAAARGALCFGLSVSLLIVLGLIAWTGLGVLVHRGAYAASAALQLASLLLLLLACAIGGGVGGAFVGRWRGALGFGFGFLLAAIALPLLVSTADRWLGTENYGMSGLTLVTLPAAGVAGLVAGAVGAAAMRFDPRRVGGVALAFGSGSVLGASLVLAAVVSETRNSVVAATLILAVALACGLGGAVTGYAGATLERK
jgi:hypothetical protein